MSPNPNIPQIIAAVIRYDRARAQGPTLPAPLADDERRITPAPAKEAAPYLRQLFDLINDPELQGHSGRAMPLSVPVNLRDFVTGYMLARGWIVDYSIGQDSKESRVLLTRSEDA